MKLAFVALVACGLVGCAAASASDEPTGHVSSPIVGGALSDASEDFVVFVSRVGATTGFCAGTLVAPNLVVTALHCVAETDSASFACDANGNVIPGGGGYIKGVPDPKLVRVLAGANALGRWTIDKEPGLTVKEIVADGESALCSHDVAFLVLERPATGMPIASLRLDSRVNPGSTASVAGWGEAEDRMLHFERRHRTAVPVLAAGPAVADEQSSLGATVPRTFLMGQGGCFGDSGAPAFVGTDVLGVMSRGIGFATPVGGGSQCTAVTANVGFMMIVDFGVLMKKAFEAAAAKPTLGDGSTFDWLAFGGACKLDVQCASNVCTRGTCNLECGRTACPSGYTCEDGTRRCVPNVTPRATSEPEVPSSAEPAAPPNALAQSARSDCAVGHVGTPRSGAGALALAAIAGVTIARRRRRSAGLFVTALGLAMLANACSASDEATSPPPPTSTTQAGPDPTPAAPSTTPGPMEADASTTDAASPVVDAAPEASADASPDAETLPPICTTYPNTTQPFLDGGTNQKRYMGIAITVMQRAKADCAIGAHFQNYGTTSPIQLGCFVNQIMALAGCTDVNGVPLVYETSVDVNRAACVDLAGNRVLVGFHNPQTKALTNADVDRFLGIVQDVAATDGKLALEDAKRLRAALAALRSTAVGSLAAGFSAAAPGCNVVP